MLEIVSVDQFLSDIKEILQKILFFEKLDFSISLDTILVGGLGPESLDLSSIDYVDFLAAVEKKYCFVYDFDVQIRTVGDIYKYIQTHDDKIRKH